MTQLQFEKFQKLIYDEFGNALSETKIVTLDIKIHRIMSKFHKDIKTIDEYYDKLMAAGKSSVMWEHFVDNMTVHKTNFYRENDHFEFLKKNLAKICEEIVKVKRNKEIRIWCAAASSGEEPYTIAMVLDELLPNDYSIKFLATDISEDVLRKAIKGEYTIPNVEGSISKDKIKKYFIKSDNKYIVNDSLKKKIVFRKFNLMNKFNFKYKFDIVFCRNVMIYFDEETKSNVINKISDVLDENGVLFVGLSESIGMGNTIFKRIGSSIYQKKK